MKVILTFTFLLFIIFLFSQDTKGFEKDTLDAYYMQEGKLFHCDFIKTGNENIGLARKCINERQVLPNTEEYKKHIEIYPPVKINKTYAYDLPYKKGQIFRIIQGYNGDFTHQNKNALDFDMPIGTEVLAIRDGIVLQVVQKHNRGCPTEKCEKYANYVLIVHEDGTIAGYYHLRQNEVIVKVRDKVKKGDVIAYSGNTGFSSTPHLHLECYFYNGNRKKETMKTLFKTNDGKRFEYLYEGKSYLKNLHYMTKI